MKPDEDDIILQPDEDKGGIILELDEDYIPLEDEDESSIWLTLAVIAVGGVLGGFLAAFVWAYFTR